MKEKGNIRIGGFYDDVGSHRLRGLSFGHARYDEYPELASQRGELPA
jgi:hypothetical protein